MQPSSSILLSHVSSMVRTPVVYAYAYRWHSSSSSNNTSKVANANASLVQHWERCCAMASEQNFRHSSQGAIYTTKIEEFVCPPNISETVAGRITKLAHRPRIASTTIKLISKPMLLSILSILLNQLSESALARAFRFDRFLTKHRPGKHG